MRQSNHGLRKIVFVMSWYKTLPVHQSSHGLGNIVVRCLGTRHFRCVKAATGLEILLCEYLVEGPSGTSKQPRA